MIYVKRHINSREYKLVLLAFILSLFICACTSKNSNHLSAASSPYLKQHADNPVNWYEWGSEAMQRAKRENKPLLISIGYASCHWCHQMAKESFMDTAVARFMNQNFICIKVDREERPDIDNVYSNACQLISGNAGWPLNAFALPDGKPFFAGTYYSRQGWLSLLKQIDAAYKTQNKKVLLQAQALSNGIAQQEFAVLSDSAGNGFDKTAYQHLFSNIYPKMDLSAGGLKGMPKFPAPALIEFLLQYHFLTHNKSALDAATTTLNKMALGGVYDQVGGGFTRYATDSLWRIPHFEKMLYANAQLISIYAHAYQVTGDEFFKKIAQEITGFIQRDLTNISGGYSSSVNADTKDGEGSFYTWTAPEFAAVLPANNRLTLFYNISSNGNWKAKKNILYALASPLQFACANGIDPVGFNAELSMANKALLDVRNKRAKPTIDDKVLTSWNALLLEGFADVYTAFGEKHYLELALDNARFLEKRICSDGKLYRTYHEGKEHLEGFLDDYALLAKAYIKLYQITFDIHWLNCAKLIAHYAIKNFYEPKSGMFYYSAVLSDSSLVRKLELADNVMPSSNAVMAGVLYKLGVYFDDETYRVFSKKMLAKMSGQLSDGKTEFYGAWCFLAGLFSYGSNEVAIMGKNALTKNVLLQQSYLPASVFMGSAAAANLPFLEGKTLGSETLIYICKNGTCKRPVPEIAAALEELKKWQDRPLNQTGVVLRQE
ncbi:MAG: thioredoxin domain-containing protein [Chitinophagaceae bacterium]